jgi:cytochrome c-type biogenesis protein CcmF
VLAGTVAFVAFRWRRAAPGRRFTAEIVGMVLAHAGIGVFVLGVMMTEGTSIEKDVALGRGESVDLRGYVFRFEGVERINGPNYVADRGRVVVLHGDREIATLMPEKRGYASGGQIMTEAAIDPALHRDLYVALGEPLGRAADTGEERWSLRVYLKPWIRCIWLGALMMMFGGFIAAADRRFRVASAVGVEEAGAAARPQPAAA